MARMKAWAKAADSKRSSRVQDRELNMALAPNQSSLEITCGCRLLRVFVDIWRLSTHGLASRQHSKSDRDNDHLTRSASFPYVVAENCVAHFVFITLICFMTSNLGLYAGDDCMA